MILLGSREIFIKLLQGGDNWEEGIGNWSDAWESFEEKEEVFLSDFVLFMWIRKKNTEEGICLRIFLFHDRDDCCVLEKRSWICEDRIR